MTALVLPGSTESRSEQALAGAYSDMFCESALGGHGAWSREATSLIVEAAQAGITLEEETLIVSDVRDLQALRHKLVGPGV